MTAAPRRIWIGVCVAVLLTPRVHAQSPLVLRDVLAKFRSYLASYSEQYSATVSIERYRQTSGLAGNLSGYREAYLESSFGIIRLPEAGAWQGFRDVFRVNGRTVQDREDRLARLFNDPSGVSLAQAAAVAEESARFNIGPVRRTINNPALVFEMVAPSHQSRLFFSKSGDESMDGVRVWVINFSEQPGPTLVRSSRGDYEPADGRIWVDPISGRLHRADVTIRLPDGGSRESISVTFREDPRLPFWVPGRMIERYEGPGLDRAGGEATYSDYRLFSVQTQEDFLPSAR